MAWPARPFSWKYRRINLFPKASGRESAKTPGSPSNALLRRSSGNSCGPLAMSRSEIGEMSSPSGTKSRSNSKIRRPSAVSAMTPTLCPHSITVAVVNSAIPLARALSWASAKSFDFNG